jgi:hypothetical protein
MNAALKIPTAFPLITGGLTVGIFAFWDVYIQTPFFRFVYTDFKTAGISTGWQIPLILGSQ